MIANIASCEKFLIETCNTLNFASKSKLIYNNVQQLAPAHNTLLQPAIKRMVDMNEKILMLSPMVKKRRVISDELVKRCENVERKILIKDGKIPIMPEQCSPRKIKMTPNSKATYKQCLSQIKHLENIFEFAGAIEIIKNGIFLLKDFNLFKSKSSSY